MNKDQLRELLESLTTSFAQVANTIANTKKEPEDKRELMHVKIDPFHESDNKDPIEWLEAFERATAADNWTERRMLKIAASYLRDLAANWYKGKRDDLTQWKNDEEEESKRRHGWQIKLQELKQLKHEKVNAYATKFKKLLKWVDPDDEIPDPYIIRMFLSGLRGKAATFVTVAEPKDLDEAITKARKAEAKQIALNYATSISNRPKAPLTTINTRVHVIVKSVETTGRKIHERTGPGNLKEISPVSDGPGEREHPTATQPSRTRLNGGCPLPLTQENDHQEPIPLSLAEAKCTTAAHCYIRIRGNHLIVVLDSEAAVSIMTKKLLDKLDLKIQEKSSTVVVTTTGAKTWALRRITNVGIVIQDALIASTFQIIKSSIETLLLETNWFLKAHARLHFDEWRLYLKHQDRTVEVPISHTGNNDSEPRDQSTWT
ncbi:186_t:CDS:2 [Gigaspora rosea]|nr:186_t:CDS:2 [Gigaspora rosea]